MSANDNEVIKKVRAFAEAGAGIGYLEMSGPFYIYEIVVENILIVLNVVFFVWFFLFFYDFR